ncbi:MAG TPA: hypothetical protein VN370_12390, partial [Desulfitobacteriaceae bacterium]|nr:hypothetical protein [Desulfitobacteriaceae bacterium]
YCENNIPYFNPEEETEVFDEFENQDCQNDEDSEENEPNYYPGRYNDFIKRKVVHLNYFYS